MSNSTKLYESALTVDVEDGINISMFDNFGVEMEPTSRVIDNMKIVLDTCEKNNVKGTFFMLGEIAEKYPDLIKKVSALGHEIGVHGYKHDQVFRLTPQKLKEDLSKAKVLLSDISGQEVKGYRAPAFSINSNTAWALPVLAECGFKYDSSIFPSLSLRYGWKDFSKDICRIELNSGLSIVEVPLSTKRMLGRDIPVGGGGYLRYFSYRWTKSALKSIIKERPAIVYMHPYELDEKKYPDYYLEEISKTPLKRRIPLSMYRLKKNTVAKKLDLLMQDFKLMPLKNIIEQKEANNDMSVIKID